jgi:hypothetical protein
MGIIYAVDVVDVVVAPAALVGVNGLKLGMGAYTGCYPCISGAAAVEG